MQDTPAPSRPLPAWYAEVPAAERSADFQQTVGNATMLLCERETKQLICSFGHSEDIDHPELDWPAWTDRLARERGWTHLSITVPKGSWFRDPHLIETLQNLSDFGFFERFTNTTLFGAASHGGGFAALAFAPLCPGAVVLALDAQSTLRSKSVPWEDRFDANTNADWELPFSDTARALTKTKRAYVAYDPFERRNARHIARLPGKRITPLRCFGLNDDIGIALKRLGLMDDVLIAAVAGTLAPADWYKMLRGRKDLYLYRRIMEEHLSARGKADRSGAFVTAFRNRKRLRKAQAERQSPAPVVDKAPVQAQTPGAFDHVTDQVNPPALAGRRYPRTLGNVWALRDEPTGFRYMSDQYAQTVMGFEERDEVTLGETHPLAIGMAAFGGRAGMPRALPEDFRFHVVDDTLAGRIAPFQAKSQGVSAQRHAAAKSHAYRTIIALSQDQAGITAPEALPDSGLYTTLMHRISAARDALRGWNKEFHLDRIALSLLSGAPHTEFTVAVQHYGDVAKAMRYDAAIAAGQASFPHIVVSQSAGSRFDGTSEVILAEGQLDALHAALGVIVATPTYPFALMDDMPATLAPTAQALVDELEVLAVAAVQDNRRWYCPSVQQAFAAKNTVTVAFSSLSDLVLEDGPHGFALRCDGPAPGITSAEVRGKTVVLTLDGDLPEGEVYVSYAWGATRSTGDDNRTANQGAVRDSWSQRSALFPDQALHRYALSGRVRIMPSDFSTPGGKR